MSRYHVKSFGCQMNVYDSERMGDLLAGEGHVAVDSPEAADIVVLNTCHIREKAAEKLYSDIGRLRKPRADGSRPVIVAAGCVAQAEGAEIGRRAPAVDVIVGPLAYHRLPELLREAAVIPEDARGARWGRAIDTDMPAEPKFNALPPRRHQGASAFLTVQEGCDKFCTFCVVPYTRGGEVSRPFADLVAEAEALVAAGAVEITLIGQNVNAYGLELGGGATLPALIAELAKLEGLKRIRYTTSHPNEFGPRLIEAYGRIDKLVDHVHLPVQHGSDRILSAMKRGYTALQFKSTVRALRRIRPGISLSSDFIVGFPGETDEDFVQLMAMVEDVGFDSSFSFIYSPRPGTPAANLADDTPHAVKLARLQTLQAAIERNARAIGERRVGTVQKVLVEGPSRRDPSEWMGRTPCNRIVNFNGGSQGQRLVGQIVDLRITMAYPHSLRGEVAGVDGP